MEVALARLANRPIKASTHNEYLGTLRTLGLEDVPIEEATVAMLNRRLQGVLNPSTRRKHSINLRASLGVPIKWGTAPRKVYDLPPLAVLHEAISTSPYAVWGYVMLYGGLRLGESCVSQPLSGRVLNVDRQRLPSGAIASAKTCGPVVLPTWLAEAYRDHDFERSANTVYVGIRRAGRKHGLTLNPHQLRHAYATNLVRHGANPEVLRRQMRHHNISVSLNYYVQVTQEDIEGVVEGLSEAVGRALRAPASESAV